MREEINEKENCSSNECRCFGPFWPLQLNAWPRISMCSPSSLDSSFQFFKTKIVVWRKTNSSKKEEELWCVCADWNQWQGVKGHSNFSPSHLCSPSHHVTGWVLIPGRKVHHFQGRKRGRREMGDGVTPMNKKKGSDESWPRSCTWREFHSVAPLSIKNKKETPRICSRSRRRSLILDWLSSLHLKAEILTIPSFLPTSQVVETFCLFSFLSF